MVAEILSLEPVRNGIAAPRMRAGKADLRRQIENDGQVGRGSPDSELFKALDERQVDLADDALINPRGIEKAVADHPLLRPQGRFYERVEMVGARCRKQQGFRVGTEALGGAGQQYVANDLSAWRAAGLPGQHDANAHAG